MAVGVPGVTRPSRTETVPAVGANLPSMMLNKVDFPAPFRPRKQGDAAMDLEVEVVEDGSVVRIGETEVLDPDEGVTRGGR